MGLETLEITLNHPHRSYFAGQIVAGKVIVSLAERSAKIKVIKLKLTGKAKTHWKEATGRTTSTVGDNESYINEKVYLFGYGAKVAMVCFTPSSITLMISVWRRYVPEFLSNPESGADVVLEPGTVEYPFHFTLPVDLPSSFEHKYGSVKYQLEAVIVRSSKSFKYNYNTKVLFTVNGILDLNNEWDAKHEGESKKQKNVCCFCCTSGPLGFQLKLPRKGFVPGECIPFDAELYNNSRRTIMNITFALVQEIKFTGGQHSKKKLVPISSVDGPTLEPGESISWLQNWLPIPSLPPSRLGGCNIIELNYFVKLKMEVKDAMTLKGQIPLIIGTIPLRAQFTELTYGRGGQVPSGINGELSPGQRVSDTQPSTPILSDYPDLPPPKYEDCLFFSHPDYDTEEDPPAYDEGDNLKNGRNGSNSFLARKSNLPDSGFVPKYVTYGCTTNTSSASINANSSSSK